MENNLLVVLPILLPIVAGVLAAGFLKLEDRTIRQIYVAFTVIFNVLLLFFVLRMGNSSFEVIKINDILSISLKVDDMSRLFTVLASFLWICATFYSFEYMKHEGREKQFFVFLLITLGITIALGFSANLFTFYLFYEAMTLTTYPLVIHSMSKEAKAAGIKYLIYSFIGAALVLIGIFFVATYGHSLVFVEGGIAGFKEIAAENKNVLLVAYVLMFIGFGGKAGMFPLHAWLPIAHPVAPAPASGLLSGIITKAGVLGIIRTTYFIFGADFIFGTAAHTVLLIVVLFTIFMGSMLAFKEKHLKRRLAYSSVSQVSYVLFGLILLNRDAFTGALLHMVIHALIKNILFLSVGAIIYKTDKTYSDEIKGIGKSMPVTMWCFTLASLALIGIPPASGFVSKWYLAMGGLNFPNYALGFFGVVILLVSALLTAGYLVPVFANAFFPGADFDYRSVKKLDPNAFMLVPLVVLTALAVGFGVFPNQLISFIMNITTSIQ